MTTRTYARLAAFLFAIIAVLQFIRALGGWQIMVNGTVSIPVWASWIAGMIAAGLAGLGFNASRRDRPSKEQRKENKERRKKLRKQEREARRSA